MYSLITNSTITLNGTYNHVIDTVSQNSDLFTGTGHYSSGSPTWNLVSGKFNGNSISFEMDILDGTGAKYYFMGVIANNGSVSGNFRGYSGGTFTMSVGSVTGTATFPTSNSLAYFGFIVISGQYWHIINYFSSNGNLFTGTGFYDSSSPAWNLVSGSFNGSSINFELDYTDGSGYKAYFVGTFASDGSVSGTLTDTNNQPNLTFIMPVGSVVIGVPSTNSSNLFLTF